MLVLTRKLNEEVLIGDDIKITLLRMQGGSVRIGIDAPREIRILRGELERLDVALGEEADILSTREEAFAHPHQAVNPVNRLGHATIGTPEPTVFVGTVKSNGEDACLKCAPLANFLQQAN